MLLKIRQDFGKVTSSCELAKILREIFATQHPFDRDKEQLFAVGMNTRNVIRYIDLVSMGVLDASLVHPREVFRHAVTCGVAKIAVAHNHPSGNSEPSPEDFVVTSQLIQAGEILGVPVIDHLIITCQSDESLSLRMQRPEMGWGS